MEKGSLAALLGGLLFPRRCPYCGRVQGFAAACSCAPQLPGCLLTAAQASLQDGSRSLFWLDGGSACYSYTGPVRSGIQRMKFGGLWVLAEGYGQQMAARVQPQAAGFDALVPVPSTRASVRSRGYDLPLLLARAAAGRLAIPVWGDILVKEHATPAQHRLPLARRRSNLNGAFGLRGAGRLQGKRLLLCDDVCTSGATLEECARVLKGGGAAQVYGLVIAKTPRGEKG